MRQLCFSSEMNDSFDSVCTPQRPAPRKLTYSIDSIEKCDEIKTKYMSPVTPDTPKTQRNFK